MSGASHAAALNNNNNRDKHAEKQQKISNNLSKIANNDKSNGAKKQPQGEKIQSLKNQIEKQMKAYAKQEEYEEMLKLIKVRDIFPKLFYCQLTTKRGPPALAARSFKSWCAPGLSPHASQYLCTKSGAGAW